MDPVLAELLKDAAEPAGLLGQKLNELGTVVLESVLSKQTTVSDPLFTPTEPDEITEEFGVLPHIALEMRIALSDTEAYLMATLITLDDAKTLLGNDITTGDEVALQSAQRTAGELSDLIALMLFTDSPVRGAIQVTEARYDSIAETVGMIVDVAQGSPLARLEYDIVEGDNRAHLTHIVPVSLISNLATRLQADGEPEAAAEGGDIKQSDLDSLDLEDESAPLPINANVDVHPAQFMPFEESSSGPRRKQGLDLILDVSLRVSVELGRTVLTVQDVLGLGPGSVVELDKLAGEPVDIFVNDRIIAKGEVVVVDENFGVRVTEIVPTTRRAPAAATA